MKPEETIFEAARQLADPEAQAAYLNSACGEDQALRQRIEQLLRAARKAKDFFQKQASTLPLPPAQTVPEAAITEGPGSIIGRYKLLQRIGEGGCGVVYMAEQEEPVRRRVALKVIKLGMDTREVIARFEAERQALALMDHPNIAKVHDAGSTDTGRPYFVMELVRGIKITEFCDESKLSTEERLKLFIQVCQAIQHAHQKGVIHRDIKPSNILVTINDGAPVPKVIDFGIAKATAGRLTDQTLFTAFEQFIGTPAYMSPEQAVMTSLDIDTRSDVYSLGVLLYELLTGRTPFDQKELLAAGLDEMRRTIREQEPPRPSTRLSTMAAEALRTTAKHRHTDAPKLIHLLRGDLDWIVMKALEKERARRYETANGLANDIQRHLNNEPVMARPPSHVYRFQKLVRRNKLAFAAAAGIAAALVLGVAVSAWQAVRATRAEHQQSILRAGADKARENEAGLRSHAEEAKKLAQIEATRAEAAALDLKRTLSASDFVQGVRFIAENNGSDALAFLTRSLSANPSNEAALTRLTTLLTYHSWLVPTLVVKQSDPATWVRFNPDGTRFVTASADMTARVWDAQTGQAVTGPIMHDGRVVSAGFSPDGQRIITASRDGIARVWDAQTGQPLGKPMKIGDASSRTQFSPDGQRIVTHSAGGTARVWDVQTGQALGEPMKHRKLLTSAQFSPDGQRIVTASWDFTARVWDAQTGQPLSEALKHRDYVHSAQFSPDGQRIVTASADATARLWDAQTGEPISESMKHSDSVTSAQFSPDGKLIVTASRDRTARVWDAQTCRPLGEPLKHGGLVYSAQFNSDGKRVVTASQDRTARVWDAQTGQPLAEPLTHGEAVHSAQFTRDGKRIATVSVDYTARVWQRQASPPLVESMLHSNHVYAVVFSPDGKRIVTGSSLDGTALVWDAQTSVPLTEPMKHEKAVLSVQFSPDGKRVVTGSGDTTVRVWDAQTGQPLVEPMKHGGWIHSAEFSPDGKHILTSSHEENMARVWDAQTGRVLAAPMQHSKDINSAHFSPDGRHIVTASSDGTARLWNAQTGQPLGEPMKHGSGVSSAQFSSDGRRIVTASSDGVRVWDAQTAQPLGEPMKQGRGVSSAQFSSDGKRIVTGSFGEMDVHLWDAQTGQPLAEPMYHVDSVVSAEFSSDGKRIVTGSHDRTARVWDAQTGQPLSEPFMHGDAVLGAHFSPDGKRIVTVSWNKKVRVWDIAPTTGPYPDWLLQLSEAISGQVLNNQGVLEETRLNRLETLNQIRQKLSQEKQDDDWVIWGRWFLADRATRTISPFSKITVPDYIENRIKEKTHQSLDVAERLAAGQPEILRRISETRQTLGQPKE